MEQKYERGNRALEKPGGRTSHVQPSGQPWRVLSGAELNSSKHIYAKTEVYLKEWECSNNKLTMFFSPIK